jgi:glycolate oxidase iron-sulfur subunit
MARAFDDIRPPQPELLDDCVHCGFCLPTCPTYSLWGEEMDSPRGRIVLMRTGLEEGSELSGSMVQHIDRCLGCMACVTACPSGVQYDKLIEDTRAQIERGYRRPPRERVLRRLIFATFPHPGRLRALVPLLVVARRLGLMRLARRIPKLRDVVALAPAVRLRDAVARVPRRTAASGSARGRVGFLQGCVQRTFFADVNRATVKVLAAEGYDVEAPRRPRCCGALQLHAGDDAPARARAKATIEAFEHLDVVVTNAAGCGSAMKDYGHLLREEPEWAERAASFAAKVRDATELLADHEPRATRHRLPLTVAYHDACHLAHAQGIREQPRKLLAQIPGLEVREPAGWEHCCGSAGIYNLTEPGAATVLGRRKAEALRATGSRVVVAANPGCALQIAGHSELRVRHPMELLAMSIEGEPDGDWRKWR